MKPLTELRLQPHWSCSALRAFLGCPFKWACRYVYGADAEFTPVASAFGWVFHQAVLAARVQAKSIVQAQDYFSELWLEHCRHTRPQVNFEGEGKDPDSLNVTGRKMLAVLWDKRNPEERIVATNQVFSVQFGGCRRECPCQALDR